MTKPMLVLLPGLDGTGELFRPLVAVLPPDQPRRVLSYPRETALSYAALFRLIEAELEIEREMVLLAESFSGPLALRYASQHCGRVRAVVLCASFIRSPVPRWFWWLVRPLLFRVSLPGFVVRQLMLGRGAPAALVETTKSVVRTVKPSVLSGRLREVMQVDAAEALRRCHAPILYLAASRDALVRRRSVDRIRAIRPDIYVRVVEGPHLLLQRSPSAAWREIDRFLTAAKHANREMRDARSDHPRL